MSKRELAKDTGQAFLYENWKDEKKKKIKVK